MISFTKQTTPADEAAIEQSVAREQKNGFKGDTIIYRNSVDAALARIALSSIQVTGPKLSGPYGLGYGPDMRFAIIMTSSYDDGKIIRERVNQLREQIAPSFGVTPEEPKPAPPPKHQPFRP